MCCYRVWNLISPAEKGPGRSSEKIMLEYTDPEEMSLDLRGVVETMFW